MKELKKYKTLTTIFFITTLLLLAIVFRMARGNAGGDINKAKEALKDCASNLASWRADNPEGINSNDEAQTELEEVLQGCAESL